MSRWFKIKDIDGDTYKILPRGAYTKPILLKGWEHFNKKYGKEYTFMYFVRYTGSILLSEKIINK